MSFSMFIWKYYIVPGEWGMSALRPQEDSRWREQGGGGRTKTKNVLEHKEQSESRGENY